MLHSNEKPDILHLLSKIQEATTSDVDEERGSFKKGDKVTYNMLGGSLSNSDLIKTLGVDEHVLRVRHDGTVAEIVEAMGEEVARYSLQFDDGFVINDVAVSEVKVIVEAEDATQTMKPQEKPNISAEDFHMEDYSDEDLNKPEAKVKSKSEKSGDAIRAVEDDELEQKEDKVVEPKNEAVDTLPMYTVTWRNTSEPEASDRYVDVPANTPERAKFKAKNVLKRSGVDLGVVNITSVSLKEANLVNEVSQLEMGIEIEKEHTDDPTEAKKIAQDHLKEDPKYYTKLKRMEAGACDEASNLDRLKLNPATEEAEQQEAKIIEDYLLKREAGWSREDSVQYAAKGSTSPQEVRKLLAMRGVTESEVGGDSKLSFMKKQEPLWLCNECYKTFRANECNCVFCESMDADKIGEGYGDLAGSTKEVFQVTWEDVETGKEESTRVMAFDKPAAKREAARPGRKITKVEGPISSESKKENKAPFEQVSEGSELQESVSELIGETPGISVEQVKVLRWAIENNAISNEWPSEEAMMDQLSKADEEGRINGYIEDPDGLNLGEEKPIYLKYILLPKAIVAYEKLVSESEVSEMEQEGIPEAGKTYHIRQTTGRHWPEGDYKVTAVDYLRCARGDLAKQFQVEGNDNWWMAEFYHFDEVDDSKVGEAKKEVEPFRTIEIVRSQIDPDAYNIRVVELPKGDMVILDTRSDKKAALVRGKELAQTLNAKFLGIIDEKKVIEQEEDAFVTVGKGLEKVDAEKLAQEKGGQVITDEDDDQKFAVITKGA